MLGYVVAFAQALCFAGTSIMLKRLAQHLNVFVTNTIRAFLAILVIVPLLFITGGWSDLGAITWVKYAYLAASIILGGVFGEVCYINSLKRIGVSRTFPITNAFPVITVIISVLFLGEAFSWLNALGLVLVIGGVYIIARPRDGDEDEQPLERRDLLIGVGLALVASLAWGLGTVVVSLGAEGINGVLANAVRLPLIVVISWFMAWRQGAMGEIKDIDGKLWLLLLLAAIVSWVITRSFYVMAVKMIGPSRTSIISATAPMFAIPLSMLFLKERPTKDVWIGAVLTILGIVLVV